MRRFVVTGLECHPGRSLWRLIGFIAILAFSIIFVACGGDSGTSANNNDESSSSSSSVISASSGNRPSSSNSRHSGTDPESSNSKKASSSSSKGIATNSSGSRNDVKSSSSVILSSSRHSGSNPESSNSKQSSSSKKVESSSSSLRLSSANLSSSSKKVESSSSEKNSVLSSSRDYRPYAHDTCLAGNWNYKSSDYKTFVDPRNGRSYYYITVYSEYKGYSVTVMAENLNIGEMVLGENDQNDDSKIERYCYNNDTTYCDHYGGLYQWAEMMQLPSRCNTESCSDLIQPNHRGICPDGWRLFTWDDYTVVAGFNDDRLGESIAEGLRSQCFSGYNTSGFSLIGGGERDSDDGLFKYLNEYALWAYPQEFKGSESWAIYSALVSKLNNESPGRYSGGSKKDGLSVRCTKLE